LTITRSGSAALVAVVVALVLAGCGGSTSKDSTALAAITVPDTIKVTSPAFTSGAALPRVNSCDGTGSAPTLAWTGIPVGAKAVAVVVDDPDANHFLQWLVVGLPPAAGTVPDHGANVSELDNTGGTRGWAPLCPPAGSTHHYDFTVYALNDYICADNSDTSTGADCSPPASAEALDQIAGAAVAKGTLSGTYSR
jgi:Raf kinase inhibitor-like YbhB/YbcL family protein